MPLASSVPGGWQAAGPCVPCNCLGIRQIAGQKLAETGAWRKPLNHQSLGHRCRLRQLPGTDSRSGFVRPRFKRPVSERASFDDFGRLPWIGGNRPCPARSQFDSAVIFAADINNSLRHSPATVAECLPLKVTEAVVILPKSVIWAKGDIAGQTAAMNGHRAIGSSGSCLRESSSERSGTVIEWRPMFWLAFDRPSA